MSVMSLGFTPCADTPGDHVALRALADTAYAGPPRGAECAELQQKPRGAGFAEETKGAGNCGEMMCLLR